MAIRAAADSRRWLPAGSEEQGEAESPREGLRKAGGTPKAVGGGKGKEGEGESARRRWDVPQTVGTGVESVSSATRVERDDVGQDLLSPEHSE